MEPVQSVATRIILEGECMDAIALYEKAFGAKRLFCVTYGEMLPNLRLKVEEGQKAWVLQAEVMLGGHRLRFQDSLTGGVKKGDNPCLVVFFETDQDLIRAYDIITMGCRQSTPVAEKFYASTEAEVTDQYGLHWSLLCERS